MDDLTTLGAETVELFNNAAYDGIRAVLAPGFRYEETGTGLAVEGADDFIAALQAWRTAVPDATGEVTRAVADGETTVLEIVWRGTQNGPLPTPAGILPPSGRPFEFRATLWQTWADGKIVAERHHLDVLALLAQLGALPAPAPA